MEALSLMLGIVLMLVAAVGIVLYVALVIAIPVCRALDWLAGERPDAVRARPRTRSAVLCALRRLTGRKRSECGMIEKGP